MARSSLTFLAAFFLVMLPLVTILVFVATHADLESTNDSSLKSLLRRPRRRAQSRWAPAVPQPNATAPTDRTAAAPAAPRPLAHPDLECSRKEHDECVAWAESGECTANPGFMSQSCKQACGLCPGVAGHRRDPGTEDWDSCKDKSTFCGQWAAVGECDSNPNYMKAQCKVTCHLCQSRSCHDEVPARCAGEAKAGKCESEPERMYRECRWACRWCAMTDRTRCRRADGTAPALPRAGVMNAMFERALTDDAFAKYEPVALSRSPWVLQLDHFLDGSEAEHLIGVGTRNSWSRSMAGDGVQAVRTSSTSWCSAKSGCGGDVLRGVRRRIENVTMVPASNAEHLQLLKYERGQFYRWAHSGAILAQFVAIL